MKILLDTNIIIHREGQSIRNSLIGQLFYYMDKFKHDKCIHQISIDELKKYGDKKSVDVILTKSQSYVIAESIVGKLDKTLEIISQKNDKSVNDINDTLLLNELLHGKFDIFVTEDKLIHEKARQLQIEDKVYYIENYLENVFSDNPELINYKILSIKKERVWKINLDDIFFDSLKNDYQGFEKWYHKKAEEFAYVYFYEKNKENNKIGGFLYLKKEGFDEDYSNITPIFNKKIRLKIGTFKVSLNGLKIGERFIKIIFDNAIANKVEEIYVTIFEKTEEQRMLIRLLEEFGFTKHGIKVTTDGEEVVYIRKLDKTIDYEIPTKTYPYITTSKNNIYLVPIKPEYHTELFPDSILNNENFEDFMIDRPHQNSIRKTYISHAYGPSRNGIKIGDILIFYRTGGRYRGVITTIGVVESKILNIASEENLINLCRKRTVFKPEELSKLWNKNPYSKPFLINFLYIDSLKNRINNEKMKEVGIINSDEDLKKGPHKLTLEQFNKIITIGNGNKGIIID